LPEEENPPRDGFFEHDEYLKVRAQTPASYQDVLDFAYYSGWRRNEILHLIWEEVDLTGGVIRLSPRRSKTRSGRVLPISAPLRAVLNRRLRVRHAGDRRRLSTGRGAGPRVAHGVARRVSEGPRPPSDAARLLPHRRAEFDPCGSARADRHAADRS
jgi:integrase